MSVFSTTDRVQHMMYKFYDPSSTRSTSPRRRTARWTFFGETIKLSDAIPAIYKQMDRVIGDDAQDELVGDNDTLLVCSDHGFQSFRRQVNVNNWLAENGYLAVKPGTSKKLSKALFFVDWKKTKVYSLGMGFLYLNLKGREKDGIVDPSEAEALMAEVRDKILQAEDPDNPGTKFCKEVYITSDIHSGPYLDLESDMILGFAPNYRVSWSSTSGGIHLVDAPSGGAVVGPICTDNDSPWSGGHVSVALPDVAGVFFSNRKVQVPEGGVRLLQIAPTALDLLDVSVPAEMDLKPLVFD